MPDLARSVIHRPRRSDRPAPPAAGAHRGPLIAVLLAALMSAPESRGRVRPGRGAVRRGDPADPGGVLLRLPRQRDQEGRGGPRRPGGRRGRLHDRDLWWASSRTCGPASCPRPTSRSRPPRSGELLEDWIKYGAFGIDPEDPDPGRVTVRRLNRVEYRNTIRDLIGVDYDTDAEFPPDDTGHGFDNIGDVLTLSPLLLEKYLAAAKTIVAAGRADGRRRSPRETGRSRAGDSDRAGGEVEDGTGPLSLSYYEPATVSATFQVEHAGQYQLVLDLTANERYVDGVVRLQQVPARLQGRRRGARPAANSSGRTGKAFRFEFDATGRPAPHELTFELAAADARTRSRSGRSRSGSTSVTVRGPMDERYWVRPPNYERFFPGEVPDDADGRRRVRPRAAGPVRRRRPSAGRWTTRRWTGSRRSPRPSSPGRGRPSRRASPRRWWPCWRRRGSCSARRRSSRARRAGIRSVDEYALASRLSYFLWSSMPDDELFRLAGEQQAAREPARPRSSGCSPTRARRSSSATSSASGSRRATSRRCSINAPAVISRDEPPDPEAERRRARFRELIRKPPEELTDAEKKELQAARGDRSAGRSAGSASSS